MSFYEIVIMKIQPQWQSNRAKWWIFYLRQIAVNMCIQHYNNANNTARFSEPLLYKWNTTYTWTSFLDDTGSLHVTGQYILHRFGIRLAHFFVFLRSTDLLRARMLLWFHMHARLLSTILLHRNIIRFSIVCSQLHNNDACMHTKSTIIQ